MALKRLRVQTTLLSTRWQHIFNYLIQWQKAKILTSISEITDVSAVKMCSAEISCVL